MARASTATTVAKEFGGKLFDTIFAGEVRRCFEQSRMLANDRGSGLRLRLRLNDAPELVDLPWEFLFDSRENRFLGLSSQTPIVRYLDLPRPSRPLAVQLPLRLLAVTSSPNDFDALDIEREWQQLNKALIDLESRGILVVERLEHATLRDLSRALRRSEIHILHFMGHGEFDASANQGVLIFEDEGGRGAHVDGQRLGTLLRDSQTLRLVTLIAGEGARASRSDPFAGIAQSLVQQGIPSVVGMQFEITDSAALAFTQEFYSALALGDSTEQALSEARKAIYAEGNDTEWATPVLYTRAPDGVIFDIQSPIVNEKTVRQAPSPTQNSVSDANKAAYENIVKELLRGRVVPFLGQGVNSYGREAGEEWQQGQSAPSGEELARNLARNFAYDGEDTSDLTRVAQYISFRESSTRLYDELHTIFAGEYKPTPLHHFWAELPARLRAKGITENYPVVLTTNYDDALERAFIEANEPFDLVSFDSSGGKGRFLHEASDGKEYLIESPTDYAGLGLERTVIVKLLGGVNRANPERDSYVITEDDFDRYISPIRELLPNTIAGRLYPNYLLFMGVNPRGNERRLLSTFGKTDRRPWAIQPQSRKGDLDYWGRLNARVLDTSLEEFMLALSVRLQTVAGSEGHGADIEPPRQVSTDTEHSADTEPPLRDSPYNGLLPYTEQDAAFFFGRSADTEIITNNLLGERLTLLYGPSGVGKSSVLQAGVMHNLRLRSQRRNSKSGAPEYIVVYFNNWRDAPLPVLLKAMADTIQNLLKIDLTVPTTLAETMRAWSEQTDADLLIILDQFEEYFLYHLPEIGEGTFADQFADAVNRSDLRANFLVSFREDALAQLDRFKGQIPDLFKSTLRLKNLDRNAGRGVIVQPISQYNSMRAAGAPEMSIEPALVEAVLDQVRVGRVVLGETGRGVLSDAATADVIELPYLQVVMTRLWQAERQTNSNVLRLETLNTFGGASGIIRGHLQQAIDALSPAEQAIAASVFERLVTPSGTKIALSTRDLAQYANVPENEMNGVLERLAGGQNRLLCHVPPSPDQPDIPRYEIFHDILAAAILKWRAEYERQQEVGMQSQGDIVWGDVINKQPEQNIISRIFGRRTKDS